MDKDSIEQVAEQELKRLEFRINELIEACARLKDENRLLRSQQDVFTEERANLIKNSDLARSKVEAMISRLKSMEQVS